jgi:NADH:ubiquinone oxidoreductase subunit 2 (subunit N)
MEWVLVVALVLGVPLSVWIYSRAFRRVYFGQEARIMVTQYTRLDAAIAFVVALYLLSPLLLASSLQTSEVVCQLFWVELFRAEA